MSDPEDRIAEALRELVALYERNSHAAPIDYANGYDTTEREKAAWAAARAALEAHLRAALAPVVADQGAPDPDLRGIDAGPVSEWVDLTKRGLVKRTDDLVRVADLPKIIARALTTLQPAQAGEPTA